MTGTERAALRLALGVLRQSLRHAQYPRGEALALTALNRARQLPEVGRDAHTAWAAQCVAPYPSGRILRARLALLLRALLRAAAADDGCFWRVRWNGDEERKAWPEGREEHRRFVDLPPPPPGWTYRLARPLWVSP